MYANIEWEIVRTSGKHDSKIDLTVKSMCLVINDAVFRENQAGHGCAPL